MMTSGLSTLDFPCGDVHQPAFGPKTTNGAELLVNAKSHQFEVDNMTDLMYTLEPDEPIKPQLDRWCKLVNRMGPVWRPVSETTEAVASFKKTVKLQVQHRAGHLMHTGPNIMHVGDEVFVLPPLGVLSHPTRQFPFPYKYARDSRTYYHPMLLNRTDFDELKGDVMADAFFQNATAKSRIGQIMAGANYSLTHLNPLGGIRPIGRVLQRHETYSTMDSSQILPGNKFTIQWNDQ